jgi:hypothetical protein
MGHSTQQYRPVLGSHARSSRHSVSINRTTEATHADAKCTIATVNVTSTTCGTPVRDQSNIIFMTGLLAGSVALIAVSIRTLMALMQDSFGLDDVFALGAEAACLPVTVIQCITPKLGFGKDTWVVPQQNIYQVLKVQMPHPRISQDLLTSVQVNMGLTNLVLCMPWTYEAGVLFLLPPDIPSKRH